MFLWLEVYSVSRVGQCLVFTTQFMSSNILFTFFHHHIIVLGYTSRYRKYVALLEVVCTPFTVSAVSSIISLWNNLASYKCMHNKLASKMNWFHLTCKIHSLPWGMQVCMFVLGTYKDCVYAALNKCNKWLCLIPKVSHINTRYTCMC